MAVFDFDAFSQTAMDVSKVDYDWHSLPDRSESLAQIIKLGGRSMEDYREKFNDRDVVSVELTWELKDETLRQEMNLQQLLVRQNVLVELTKAPDAGGVPKWGTNENQGLKDLIRSLGLANEKRFQWPMLMNQLGWVVTRNRAIDGSDRLITEVYIVKDPTAGRASLEARQDRTTARAAQ